MWFENIFRRFQRPSNKRHSADAAQLEDRIMMSASPLAVAGEEAASSVPQDNGAALVQQVAVDWRDPLDSADSQVRFDASADHGQAYTLPGNDRSFRFASSEDAQQLRYELVIIDESADNYQQLVDDLQGRQSDSRRFDIFILESHRDGIEQINNLLSGYSGLDAIHIVSHGEDGNVGLGNTWLNNDTMQAYAGQIAGWQNAMASDADLLFYGCKLAQCEEGQTLIDGLGTLTSADVTATDDDTGRERLGGNGSWTSSPSPTSKQPIRAPPPSHVTN